MSGDSDLREPAPLRADAQRMLAHARADDEMPASVRARVWRRLADEPAQAAATPARWSWALALAAAAAAVWWLASRPGPTALAQQQARDPESAVDRHRSGVGGRAQLREDAGAVVPAELPAAELPAAAAPTVASTPAPVRAPAARERPRGAAPAQPAVLDASSLARERALIEAAWSALASDDLATARTQVASHARSFSDGVLAPEREAIAAIAACRAREADASDRARRWLDAHAGSPVASRVRAACGEP